MSDEGQRELFRRFLTETAKGEPTWITYDGMDRSFLISDITRALYADKIPDDRELKLVDTIAKLCSTRKCELTLEVLQLGIVYCCVQIMKSSAKYVVPIFRVRNTSKDPEHCWIIDHLGFEYKDLNHYLECNTWPDCWLMIPEKLHYKLENEVCKTAVYVINTSKVQSFEEPTGPTEEMILESNFLLREDQENDIILMKAHLHHEHHEKFDATRRAYHDVVQPGLILQKYGDRKFIRDMKNEDLNQYYGNFNMTEDKRFIVNGKTTIHPRAFIQLPVNVRKEIMDGTRKINECSDAERDEAIESYRIEFEKSDPKKHYLEILLDNESEDDEQQLLQLFDVSSLTDIRICGIRIFGNLKRFEIRRLYKIVRNMTRDSIELVKIFAAEIKVKTFVDFCAAAEYSHKAVNKEFKRRRKEYRVATGMEKEAWEEFLKKGIINAFQNHKLSEIVEPFKDLMDQCDRAYSSNGPKFESLIAAANHVDRHAKDFSKNSCEATASYIRLAQQLTKSIYGECWWTQDGSKICCTYLSKEHSALAVKYVSYPENNGIIATLMKVKKMRDVIANCYHYLDY